MVIQEQSFEEIGADLEQSPEDSDEMRSAGDVQNITKSSSWF